MYVGPIVKGVTVQANHTMLGGKFVIPVKGIKGNFAVYLNLPENSIPGVNAPGVLVRDNYWATGLTIDDFGFDITINTISVRNTPPPPSVTEVSARP